MALNISETVFWSRDNLDSVVFQFRDDDTVLLERRIKSYAVTDVLSDIAEGKRHMEIYHQIKLGIRMSSASAAARADAMTEAFNSSALATFGEEARRYLVP